MLDALPERDQRALLAILLKIGTDADTTTQRRRLR